MQGGQVAAGARGSRTKPIKPKKRSLTRPGQPEAYSGADPFEEQERQQSQQLANIAERKSSSRKSHQHSRSASRNRFNQTGPIQGDIASERKAILLKVFQGYTSFGERTNLRHLRSNKFHKMMLDCGIPIDKTRLDLLFVAENKHRYTEFMQRPNMDFETFLNLLIKLAEVLYPQQEDLRQACDTMIEQYFSPVYKTIMTETIAGDISDIVHKEIEPEELKPFSGVDFDQAD